MERPISELGANNHGVSCRIWTITSYWC